MQVKTKQEKKTHTVVDTISFTERDTKSWEVPPFQRPVKLNRKVRDLAENIGAAGGVIPGILTLGKIGGKTYIVDGQHRIEAAKMSGAQEFYADVRYLFLDSIAEMGEEFVRLNSSLVRMTPDDVLRGLENEIPHLKKIREKCFFVTYNANRRSPGVATTLSMSHAITVWHTSIPETPGASRGSALDVARNMNDDSCNSLIDFLVCCSEAWGRDYEYARLWGRCNLILCAWLYRRLVLNEQSKIKKGCRTDRALFTKCLSTLSSSEKYLDWLVGKLFNDRNRAPCYSRITELFSKRIVELTGKKPSFPRPPWALGKIMR